jgi:gamma-glutamyl-gamma-aminobutyrate hydrolase PuuD
MQPRIAITSSRYAWPEDESQRAALVRYIEVIEDAGGIGEPVWLPREYDPAHNDAIAARGAQIATQLDGLLVGGGGDLHPSMYGEEELPGIQVKALPPARPALEAALVREFLSRGKPVLGVCYGCQFLNVWRGGSLIQDIPSQWPQPIEHGDSRHSVRVLPGSSLQRIVGDEEFEVVSKHHQGIGRLAAGTAITAVSSDQMPEALNFNGAPFFLGVQWHPECDRQSPATRRLFEAFLKACP